MKPGKPDFFFFFSGVNLATELHCCSSQRVDYYYLFFPPTQMFSTLSSDSNAWSSGYSPLLQSQGFHCPLLFCFGPLPVGNVSAKPWNMDSWLGSTWGKWNCVNSDGATCFRGQGSSECTLLYENGSLEERLSFLDGQSEYKGTIYATHSASANPPLYKSAYVATDLLDTGGSVDKYH